MEVKEAWDSLTGYLLNKKQPGTIIDKYDKYAAQYDKDLGNLGYDLPAEVAAIVKKHVNCDKSTKVLDVGVGTGLLGANLRKLGCDCVLDGIDGSQGMLDVAAKLKGVYADLRCHILTSDNLLPFADGSYDAAISSGCFSPMHIKSEMVGDLVRVVKKGGWIIVTSRDDVEFATYRDGMEAYMTSLADEGQVVKVEETNPNFFAVNYARDDPTTPSIGKCYVMKKL